MSSCRQGGRDAVSSTLPPSHAPPPPPDSERGGAKEEAIHLAVVACGDRQEETLAMLKSAVLLTARHMSFHIFAEEQLHQGFRDEVSSGNSSACGYSSSSGGR